MKIITMQRGKFYISSSIDDNKIILGLKGLLYLPDEHLRLFIPDEGVVLTDKEKEFLLFMVKQTTRYKHFNDFEIPMIEIKNINFYKI